MKNQKKSGGAKKDLAKGKKPAVVSQSNKETGAAKVASPETGEAKVASPTTAGASSPDTTTAQTVNTAGSRIMNDVNLTRSDKQRSTQMVVYTIDGRPGSVRFSKTLFVNKTAPDTISKDNWDTIFAGPKEPKRVETKEERKARLAALPKPTAAEKYARLQAKLAKLAPKVAAEQAQGTSA